jgi:phosphoenolpyruvate synthase/pyruvate phosphate dikinase
MTETLTALTSTAELASSPAKWVYEFTEGSREMRDLLGGKGAGIAEMTRILGPELVPAGFTITT